MAATEEGRAAAAEEAAPAMFFVFVFSVVVGRLWWFRLIAEFLFPPRTLERFRRRKRQEGQEVSAPSQTEKEIMPGERKALSKKSDAKLLNRWPTFREPSRGDDVGEKRPIRPLLARFCYSPAAPWGAAMQRACMAAMRGTTARKEEESALLRRRRRERDESKLKEKFNELVVVFFSRAVSSSSFPSSLGHFRENQTHFFFVFFSLFLSIQRDPPCQAHAPEQKRK